MPRLSAAECKPAARATTGFGPSGRVAGPAAPGPLPPAVRAATDRSMVAFDRGAHRADSARNTLLDLAEAALQAVDPARTVKAALRLEGRTLRVGPHLIELTGVDRARLLALGKAAVPMAEAAQAVLADLAPTGVAVSPAPRTIPGIDVIRGDHPTPSSDSLHAGHRLLDGARAAGPTEVAVVLISGGGSALAEVPAGGLDLADLQAVNDALLRCGAPIGAVNTVRKHLSALKGGQLAVQAAKAGALATVILSDVVGSPVDMVASGPTVPDPTRHADAVQVLKRFRVWQDLPAAVRAHLERGAAGELEETPSGGPAFDGRVWTVAADGAVAARAAADAAASWGMPARVIRTDLRGEAREQGRAMVRAHRHMAPGSVAVYAGETTVAVRGSGLGGRNQELALAAALELAEGSDLVVLALGTDGIDGPTPSAGAFADRHTVARGRAAGLDARDHLARNDSHRFLRAVGGTVDCGPTGTNVGDLVFLHRPASGARKLSPG